MTTMKEIARRTGVSISTVSLALNNHDVGRVKPEITAKVRQTAKDLGYQPNPLARSLRTSKTRILGFISDEIATTPYAGGMILGAQDAASELGYVMLTVNTDGLSSEDDEIAALRRYGVDGFLYAKMSNRITDVPPTLTQYPLVLVDACDTGHRLPGISPDEFAVGYDATRRLIQAGRKRIAYVGCSEPLLAQGLRMAGYQEAIREVQLDDNADLVANVSYNQRALDDVNALFDRAHPDGVFCFNDSRAWYIYECAARRSLIIGRDISVVGVDNHRVLAETLAPRLTTVELPHYEMGYWAARKLVSMLEHRPLPEHTNPKVHAPLPSIDNDEPTMIHCRLIEKDSVATRP